jgi:hypothetical protein
MGNTIPDSKADPNISIKSGGFKEKQKSNFKAICFKENEKIPRLNSK